MEPKRASLTTVRVPASVYISLTAPSNLTTLTVVSWAVVIPRPSVWTAVPASPVRSSPRACLLVEKWGRDENFLVDLPCMDLRIAWAFVGRAISSPP